MKQDSTIYLIDPFGCVRAYAETLASQLAKNVRTQLLTTAYKEVRGPIDRGDGTLDPFFLRHATQVRAAVPWLPKIFFKALIALEYIFVDLPRLRRLRRAGAVLHWQWVPLPALTAPLLRLLRVPIDVLTVHEPHQFGKGSLSNWAVRLPWAMADQIVTHGKVLEVQTLAFMPRLAGRTTVIPHPLLFHGTPAARKARKGRHVGFLGLIKDYKGIEVLLEAWRELTKHPAPARVTLRICGQSRLGKAAEARFLQELSGLPQAQWEPGYLSEMAFVEAIQEMDLVVLPHLSAGQSGVALAALGLGVPMLVSRAGALPDLMAGGKKEWVFDVGDSKGLAQKIGHFLGMNRRELDEHKQWMQRSARKFDPQRTARAHIKLYFRGALSPITPKLDF